MCYIGSTTQRLNIKINQHILSHIPNNTSTHSIVPRNQNPPAAIARHLLDNPIYVRTNDETMF